VFAGHAVDAVDAVAVFVMLSGGEDFCSLRRGALAHWPGDAFTQTNLHECVLFV
jgi:hypothetical protein